jgi:hypothetical protein
LPFDLDNPGLMIVAEAFNPADADSAVLAGTGLLADLNV